MCLKPGGHRSFIRSCLQSSTRHHCLHSSDVGSAMAFTGKYEIESQENYDAFLQHLGLPDAVIENGRNMKIVTDMVQDGNDFTWTQTYPHMATTNKFTIGVECEMHTMAGKQFKATVTMEEGKVSLSFPTYHHTVEICGDKLIERSTASGKKGTVTLIKTSKRI